MLFCFIFLSLNFFQFAYNRDQVFIHQSILFCFLGMINTYSSFHYLLIFDIKKIWIIDGLKYRFETIFLGIFFIRIVLNSLTNIGCHILLKRNLVLITVKYSTFHSKNIFFFNKTVEAINSFLGC